MKYRKKLSNRGSKKLFSRTAGGQKIHPKNLKSIMPMRGGIRG